MTNRTKLLVELREALEVAEVTEYTIETDDSPGKLRVMIPVAEYEEVHINIGRAAWAYEVSWVVWSDHPLLGRAPQRTETGLAVARYPELAAGIAKRFIAKRAQEEGLATYGTVIIPGEGEPKQLPDEPVDYQTNPCAEVDPRPSMRPGLVVQYDITTRRRELNEALERGRVLRTGEPIEGPDEPVANLRHEAIVRLAHSVEGAFDEGVSTGHHMRVSDDKLVLVIPLGRDGAEHYVHVSVNRVVPVDGSYDTGYACWTSSVQERQYGRRTWKREGK